MAYYGSYFSCLLPDSATGAAPVDAGSSAKGGSVDESSSGFSGGAYSGVGGGRQGRSSSSSVVASSTTSGNVFAQPGRKLGIISSVLSLLVLVHSPFCD